MTKEEIKAMIKDCVYLEDGITYMSDKQYNNYINIIEQLQQEKQSLKKENKILRENAEHNENCILREKHNINDIGLLDENYKLQKVINKVIEYISSNDIEVLKYHDIPSETTSYEIVTIDLLKILKGGENG